MNILTKVFVVMTTVFSLAGLVFVILILNQQVKYKTSLQAAEARCVGVMANTTKMQSERDNYFAALERLDTAKRENESAMQQTIRNLQNQIAGLERENATGKSDMTTAQASVTALTTANQAMTDTLGKYSTELADLRKQVPVLTQQNAELNRKNDEYATALEAAQNAIRRLQEELAIAQEPQPQKAPTTGAQLGTSTETPTLSAVNPINGKVTRVDILNGRTYVTLSLGKRDGVQENYRFTLYRGSSYLGDAVVRKVTPDEAVAEVTTMRPGQVVAASDLAISGINP